MRNILFAILVVCSIFVVNCHYIQYKYTYTSNTPLIGNPSRIINIYIDQNFGQQDKLEIDNAINQWNFALNNQMVLQVVDYSFNMQPDIINQARIDNSWLILKIDSNFTGIPDTTPMEECKKIANCSYTLAWTDRLGGNVLKIIRDRLSADDVQYITLHEIGHLLMLKHTTNNEDALMYPAYNKYSYLCVDQDSVNKVAKEYGLDKNHMNYCNSKN